MRVSLAGTRTFRLSSPSSVRTKTSPPSVVTVQLSRIMGDFVEVEARSGRPAEETQARVAAYLKAVEASVQALGKDGRTVLVAEAVVSGGVPDLTEQVRADVARRLGAAGAASHDPR